MLVLPNASRQFPDLLLLLRTAVALTELGRTEKRMLEKIAVCGREIVTWTAGERRKGCRGRGHVGLIGACAEGETITRNCRLRLRRNIRTLVL